MIFAVAIVVGFAFGGADQYLGSLITLGPWTVSVSQMSAPWLILPFAFGYTQRRPGRAALVALVATASALTGYFALTLSPMEGVGSELRSRPASRACSARTSRTSSAGRSPRRCAD